MGDRLGIRDAVGMSFFCLVFFTSWMIYDPSTLGVKRYLLGNWTQKIGYLSNVENISRDRLVARILRGRLLFVDMDNIVEVVKNENN